MKLFIAIVVLAFVAAAHSLSDEQKRKLIANHKICLPLSLVDEELVTKMRAGEFTNDEKLKEYIRCMFVKIGFMNEGDDVLLDAIKAKISDDVDRTEAEKVIETCKDKRGSTGRETAYLIYKCYRNHAVTPVVL
ncbi:Odorant-binding protein 56e [Carabus blaptoides fortunei]